MKKISRFTYLLSLIVCVILGIYVGSIWSNAFANRPLKATNKSAKMKSLFEVLEKKYVDSVDEDMLSEEAIITILEKLDPHSAYIKAKDLERVNSDLEGHFSGIGVTFNIQIDTAVVINVISGGPAEKVGVLPGDRIVEINDTTYVGKDITSDDFVSRLRGPKHTNVKIGVKRSSSKKLLHFTIKRGDIPVNSVDATFPIAPKIGYIKVGKFAENTYNEFVLGLLDLYRSGCNRFIIDLRGNLGGYLEVAIRMINEFLPKDRLIVYTEGKSSPRYEAKSTGDGNFKDIPIVILIDEWSASSSEIFAGAIQDNDRGEIIGRRSFGKGLMQQQFDFDDGSAIRLTIARYYTPSGRCIQKKYDMGTEDYNLDLFNRYKNGEFFSKDSIKHIDTTCYHTLSGRIVYGGYGIMPDIFIPKDTSFFSNFYNQLLGNSTLYQFCFRYAEQHRERLSSLKNVEELSAYLDQDKALEKLVEYASKNGIKGNTQEMKNDSKRFKNQIYAFITRNVCGDEMFYRFMFQNDEAILKSIEVLQKK